MTARRKTFTVTVTLSTSPEVTRAAAIRELRTRTNELCCYSLDEDAVRVRKVK